MDLCYLEIFATNKGGVNQILSIQLATLSRVKITAKFEALFIDPYCK